MYTYKKLNFTTILSDVVSRYANNPALGFIDETPITYKELGEKIDSIKYFLEELNIKPGEKAIIYSQNMPNWGLVYLSLQCMGIVAIPVLPDFNTIELQNVLDHSEASAIFISKSLEYKIKDIKFNHIKHTIRLNNFEVLQSTSHATFDLEKKSTKVYDPDENAMSILLYTSGTTGSSKGVMLSQKNVISNAFQSGKVQTINPLDRFLSVLPLSHTYENTIGFILPIVSGANVTYLHKPPTASVLVPAMKKVKPHLMLTVPLIIEKVFKSTVLPEIQKKTITRVLYKFGPTRKLLHRVAGKKLYQKFGGNLKFFGIGGAKLDAKVEQFLRDAKFPYAIGYGLTETSPLIAGSNPQQTKLQAIGPKVVNCELKIHNPDPVTGEGEIWAKGDNIMLGYYKNAEQTNDVITPDGWFKTGDLGVFDKNGLLSHKGRLKNMIVGANGENIYPEEIESIINNFHHVIESVVIQQKGRLVALVHFNREELELKIKSMRNNLALKMDETIDGVSKKADDIIDDLSKELINYINARVNKFSRIQALVIQVDPFQKTATKKIKRYLYV